MTPSTPKSPRASSLSDSQRIPAIRRPKRYIHGRVDRGRMRLS
jgi:hypothetical protein